MVVLKTNWKLLAIIATGIVLLPSPALANAGTPLIWKATLHLFLGNAIIGLVEGLLLSKLFQTSSRKSIQILIIANYVSAWVGTLLMIDRLSNISFITIENAYFWLGIFVILTFVVTLFLEYPFFWFVLKKQQKALQKALKATLIIHSISYILLFGWYATSSQVSMLTQLDVVSAQQIQLQEEYELYFLTPDSKQVVRSNLQGKNQEVVKEIKEIGKDSKLFVRQNEESKFNLLVNGEIILADFASLARPRPPLYEPVPKLTENTNWEYRTVVWAAGGIMGNNKKEKLNFQFALETPFTVWRVSNATQLEEDSVVFQLGENQVCILQPQEKRIALIAKGREPVVVKPKL